MLLLSMLAPGSTESSLHAVSLRTASHLMLKELLSFEISQPELAGTPWVLPGADAMLEAGIVTLQAFKYCTAWIVRFVLVLTCWCVCQVLLHEQRVYCVGFGGGTRHCGSVLHLLRSFATHAQAQHWC